MHWRELFEWWNAIYSVPLFFALLVFGISLLTGALSDSLDHGDVETHADVDADVAVDHELALDAEPDATPGEGSAHGNPGVLVSMGRALEVIGVGQAPLTLVLQCFVIVWGLIGLSIHALVGGGSAVWLLASVPVSLVGSAAATRGLAFAFALVFATGTSAVARSEFVGMSGRVVFPVSREEGTIHFRDHSGTLQRVRARSEHECLESGREVIILGYDSERNVYVVDDAQEFVHRRE